MNDHAKQQVMVVDDDQYLLSAIGQTLQLNGYPTVLQSNPVTALEQIKQDISLSAIIADIRMPVLDGMQLLAGIQAVDPDLPVIMITGHGDISLAVQAIKSGAYDFLEKPVDEEVLLASLRRAVEKRQLILTNRQLQEDLATQSRQSFFRGMVGCHPLMHRLYDVVETIAREPDPVLLTGETGTGKELVARAIHAIATPDGPFIAVNMAALPPEIVESELFGHERGAFTGAVATQIGKCEYAGGGTLFLDEICSLPLAQQAKLLRVLEERRFYRVGGNASIPLAARIISASNRDLTAETAAGRFREDLFYRLNVLVIEIPPLRKRKEDIPLLVEYFRQEFCRERQASVPPFSTRQLEIISERDWPGNIRELRNYIKRWCVLGEPPEVNIDHAGSEQEPGHPPHPTLREHVDLQEKRYIIEVLKACGGKVAQAHTVLGLSRKGLYDKINRYGIDIDAYRDQ